MGVLVPRRLHPPARDAKSQVLDAAIGVLAGAVAAVAMTVVARRLYTWLGHTPRRRALMIAAHVVGGAALGRTSRAVR